MKTTDLIVKCLEAEGVDSIYGLPGEENLDLVESLRTSSIELVVTRHEQHAAFMAATHGRLTGRPGVCLATLGPGATNLATGLAHAELGGFPVVAITGQKPRRENRQGYFQLVDVIRLLAPVTRWSTTIAEGAAAPAAIRRAFERAGHERPGATHVELPEDVAREDVDADAAPYEPSPRARPVPAADDVRAAAAALGRARRPVVLASGGANRPGVPGALRTLVERASIPVVTTQVGKGALPEPHPASLGCMGFHRRDHVHEAFDAADLVLALGYQPVEYPPSVWNPAGTLPVLHVADAPADAHPLYMPRHELVGDPTASLAHLADALDGSGAERAATADWSDLRATIRARLADTPVPDRDFPPAPIHVVRAAREALDDDGFLCLDNGVYKLWFARHFEARAPGTVLLDNALATMGAGLAMGMTAARLHPGRSVLSVCGDGGFVMNGQDLATAVRQELDLVVLLLRDDAFGFMRWKQAQLELPDHAMELGNPDFVRLAEAHGATALRVERGGELASALARAFSTPGPVLVDCPIDYSANDELV